MGKAGKELEAMERGKGKGAKNDGNDKERGGGSQTRKLSNKGVDRRR